MRQYIILVSDKFEEKFESFLGNLNLINSKPVVRILKSEDIVAEPKELKNEP